MESLRPGTIHLNVLLGTLVAAAGMWLLWDAMPPALLVAWMITVGGFLWWKAHTLTEVWAWSTLALGLESFAWPLLLMAQLKSASATPTEEEMGTILSAVVLGLFASVFWLSFAYGLFKRAWGAAAGSTGTDPSGPQNRPRKK